MRSRAKPVVLSSVCGVQSVFLRSAQLTVSEEELRQEALRKYHLTHATSPVTVISSPSLILLYRGCVGSEHLGIVFSIPRQLEGVSGCLAIRPAGETQMLRFSCRPVCLAETTGSKWRGICSNTHIHTRTDAHSSGIKCIHSHACMCAELSHTFFPFTLEAFTRHPHPDTLAECGGGVSFS